MPATGKKKMRSVHTIARELDKLTNAIKYLRRAAVGLRRPAPNLATEIDGVLEHCKDQQLALQEEKRVVTLAARTKSAATKKTAKKAPNKPAAKKAQAKKVGARKAIPQKPAKKAAAKKAAKS